MPDAQTPSLAEIMQLDLSNCSVIHYPYRTSRIVGSDVTEESVKYFGEDDTHRLQRRLARAAGVLVDNHEAYHVVLPGGRDVYLWFRDWKVTVGKGVVPYY